MYQENFFDPLFNTFDCIGWIPTIRGSLSLDLLDAKLLAGDIDKYLIEFKKTDGFNSSRHLVATSLVTYTDNKPYDEINCRSFRFIFHGTINDKDDLDNFISGNTQKEGLKKLVAEKELLIGNLSIVANLSNNLTNDEVKMLEALSSLDELKKVYEKEYLIDAVSLTKLESRREQLKTNFDNVIKIIREIENTSVDNGIMKIWNFTLVLSRDGFLFLKNNTHPAFNKTIFEANTPRDYTKNIPIHRVFKIAMTYIKFMFHKHYHHDKDNDSFLPVTNLHPLKSSTEQGADKMLDHQMEHFLQQVTRHKRLGNKLKCNPIGITSYARSFLDIAYYNGFITKDETAKFHKLITHQKDEAIEYLKDGNKIRDFFLTQNNFIATLTVGISFILLLTAIFRYLLFPDYLIEHAVSIKMRVILLLSTFVFGFSLHLFLVKRELAKGFNTKFSNRRIKKSRILFRSSNLKKGKLANSYIFYLWLSKIRLKISKRKVEFLLGLVFLALFTALMYIAYLVYFKSTYFHF